MILSGTATITYPKVKIDVSCDEVLRVIREAIDHANPAFRLIHTIKNGKVYVYDGINPHTYVDELICVRDATPNDVELLRVWEELQDWMYDLQASRDS